MEVIFSVYWSNLISLSQESKGQSRASHWLSPGHVCLSKHLGLVPDEAVWCGGGVSMRLGRGLFHFQLSFICLFISQQ